MDTIDSNKHDIDDFINDTWQKYAGDIGRLFKITRLLYLAFDQAMSTSQCDFFARITLKREPCNMIFLILFLS